MTVSPLTMGRLELEVGDRQRVFLHSIEAANAEISTTAAESRVMRETGITQATTATQEVRPPRHSRRPTSYFNAFQSSCAISNDAPPSYSNAAKIAPRPDPPRKERLPGYSCSVLFEKKVLLNFESIRPSNASDAGWREVYMVVRGTMISFYRVKDGRAGQLLWSYTLQHAEVGLAPDVEHTILIPQSRFARLIPTSARRRAWQKDPDLFTPVPQSILRLRAEIDQVLIADASEEEIYTLIHIIGAAIDISQPIDDRSIPRPCTVPRRRRRPRPAANTGNDLTDPAVIAEQERLFRTMYPGLAAETVAIPSPNLVLPSPLASPIREEEEFDLSMIREDLPAEPVSAPSSRPTANRSTTATTIGSTFSEIMMYETPSTNFDAETNKWHPPQLRSAQQIQRYIRRCMPVLLADAARASDICIYAGRRVRINTRTEVLEEWTFAPPSYKAHNFAAPSYGTSQLSRSVSQTSATTTRNGNTSSDGQRSSTTLDQDADAISPVEEGGLHLTLSLGDADKLDSQRKLGSMTSATTSPTNEDGKRMTVVTTRERIVEDMPVVFCF